MKSEPDEFSIADFGLRQTEEWSGVRNYQARNYLREMKLGDQFFFYHSSCAEPGIVGIGEIARIAAPDPTQFDASSDYFDPKSTPDNPRWSSVLCRFKRQFAENLTLETLRGAHAQLGELALLQRGSRLSVIPVSAAHWKLILKLEKGK